MIEFSMTNHSADPNQTYLARIRKLIHFTVRIQKNVQSKCKSQKNIFFRSVFMLKLTTPEQNSYFFLLSTVRGSKKNFWRGSGIYFIQNARIRSSALVQNMKRYLKNLEEWLLLLGMVRYLIKNARIRIYRYGTDVTLRYRNQFSVLKQLHQGYLRQRS